MGLYLEEACHLSGEAWYEKKSELLAKHQPRQRAFVLMCPLRRSFLGLRWVVLLPRTMNNPD